jgi:hypothetical protein
MTQVPSIQHTLVGSMLRQFRETNGYKLDDAARILECDRYWVNVLKNPNRRLLAHQRDPAAIAVLFDHQSPFRQGRAIGRYHE